MLLAMSAGMPLCAVWRRTQRVAAEFPPRDICKGRVEKRRVLTGQLPTMLAAMFTHSPSTETLK